MSKVSSQPGRHEDRSRWCASQMPVYFRQSYSILVEMLTKMEALDERGTVSTFFPVSANTTLASMLASTFTHTGTNVARGKNEPKNERNIRCKHMWSGQKVRQKPKDQTLAKRGCSLCRASSLRKLSGAKFVSSCIRTKSVMKNVTVSLL